MTGSTSKGNKFAISATIPKMLVIDIPITSIVDCRNGSLELLKIYKQNFKISNWSSGISIRFFIPNQPSEKQLKDFIESKFISHHLE